MKCLSKVSALLLLTLSMAVVSALANAETAKPDSEWVVVIEDPRPARLKGWQRNQYSGGSNYSRSLELKRAGKKIARQYGLDIVKEWFIESLNVYCLVAVMNDDEKRTLDDLRADKNIKWVQTSNNFQLLQAELPASKDANQIAPELFSPPELSLPATINGKGVLIALVDSAVDNKHSDLQQNISKRFDFVDKRDGTNGEAHGTAIAGIMIADDMSDVGVTGIASGAKLKAYRGCWESADSLPTSSANCNTLSLALALDAVAKENADILNLSLSGPKDQLLDEIVSQIIANGTRIISAYDPSRASNERFPSAAPGVLLVKANSDAQDFDETFTAPGSKIVAAPRNRAEFMQGHSIAAAYTSGVLAKCVQIENIVDKKICTPEFFQKLKDGKSNNNLKGLLTQLEQELNQNK